MKMTEDKTILLAKDFALPARAITESIAIMGRKGSGKTYTGGRLFEQMHKAGAQCVALDPVGNWWGLRLSANGSKRGLDIPVFGGEHGDVPITPESGKLMAETVVGRRLSCVIDLKLFRKGQRKKFVTDFAEELFHMKSTQRSPLHLFLEEARKFIPQKPFGPDELRMIGAFEDIVRLGRNYGLGTSLIDQRPQSVNKEVLSQTEILIVHQLVMKHDRKAIEDWVSEKASEGRDALQNVVNLQPGECYFWSPGLMRTFANVKVGKKHTYDASATPELDGDDSMMAPKPLSDGDMGKLREAMASVVEEIEAKDPKRLREALKKSEAEVKKQAAVIRRLEESLASRPAETKEVPVVKPADIESIAAVVNGVTVAIEPLSALLAKISKVPAAPAVERQWPPARKREARVPRPAPTREVNADISTPEQRILDAIAWLENIGVTPAEANAVAFLANYRPGGGGFNNPKGRLHTKGLIEYVRGRRIALTDAGRELAAPPEDILTTPEMHRHILGRLTNPETRILQPLLDVWPEAMTSGALAEASGYAASSGGFNNPKGRLRTLGIIDYPERGMVRARDLLFLND